MSNQLFKFQLNMLVELSNLESLLPNSGDQLMLLSKTIRFKVWPHSNEMLLAAHLYACNLVYGLIHRTLPEAEENIILTQYVEYMKLSAPRYCKQNLDGVYDSLLSEIHQIYISKIIDKQWRKINPYYAEEFCEDETLQHKDIICILDEFYELASNKTVNEFLKPLHLFSHQVFLRGRRGRWKSKDDIAPPSLQVAKENNIINRWNPPKKRYLYLASGNRSEVEQTVLAELRAQDGEEITTAEFTFADSATHGVIVNLDYERLSREEVFSNFYRYKDETISQITQAVMQPGKVPAKDAILHEINTRTAQTEQAVVLFIGQLLLKEICDRIFVPLDSDEDADSTKKDCCYKSFHMLAEYFEKKGYAGIAYPSTRMKLNGSTGSNLVIFDADSAQANESTMRTFIVGCEE